RRVLGDGDVGAPGTGERRAEVRRPVEGGGEEHAAVGADGEASTVVAEAAEAPRPEMRAVGGSELGDDDVAQIDRGQRAAADIDGVPEGARHDGVAGPVEADRATDVVIAALAERSGPDRCAAGGELEHERV